MSNHDPATEAVQRYAETLPYGTDGRLRKADLEGAAREALKPIREKHKSLFEYASVHERAGGTDYADGMRRVLAELAPLIYNTEELGGA